MLAKTQSELFGVFWPVAILLQVPGTVHLKISASMNSLGRYFSPFLFLLFSCLPSFLFLCLPSDTSYLKCSALSLNWRMALITNACSDRPSLPERKSAVALAAWQVAIGAAQGHSASAAALVSWLGPRDKASRRSHTCQLSIRRQSVPPRYCPCHRRVTRL